MAGFKACLDEIQKAAGRQLTDDEIDDLLTELNKRTERRRLLATAENLDAEVRKAADDYAAEMAEAAVIEKRNAALQLKSRLEALDFVKSQFGQNSAEGLSAILVGTNRPRQGARLSAATEQNTLTNFYLGGLHSDMQMAGIWREFSSGAFDRDVSRALWARDKDIPVPDVPEQAIKMADIIAKWQEVVRQDANAAGAWIKKMPGYIVRQSHDTYRIRAAGYDVWKAKILPRLDIERTFGTSDPEEVLKGIYQGLASGVHLKTRDQSPSGFKGPGNLAKRVSAERELHFKSADDWFDYNKEFGVGSLGEALIRGFEWHAQSTGLMRKLGPNPGANFQSMADELIRGIDDPLTKSKFQQSVRGYLSNQLAVLDGTTRIPANQLVARISSGVRASESMAKLGGSLLSQFGDLPLYASEMRYQGRSFLSGMFDAIDGLRKGRNRKEMAEVDGMIGVAMDEMQAQVAARFSIGEDSLPGGMSKMQQLFFRLNGMRWWQDSLQASAQRAMAHRLALNKGLKFDRLDPDLQRVLGLFGIDDARWNVIRAATSKEADGRLYAVADTILDLPDDAVAPLLAGRAATPARAAEIKREIADQLRSYYVDRGAYAVIEPDQRTQATMLRGTQPGTVEGEMLRFMSQFKSFTVGVAQKAIEREIYGYGANSLREALRNGHGEMQGLAQLILWSAVFGYGSMSAKDLLKGRTPRDPLNPKTFFAALAQGGGAGIYGDFLFGEVKNRFGGGILQTIAGPAMGEAANIFDLYGRVRAGDDVASAAFRSLISATPFMNLFYTRIALDYLILYQIQEWLNPGSLRRMEKRIERENDQTFLVRPSEMVR